MAHKTGEISKIHHDAAIVFAKRPYVLVILVRGLADKKDSAALMADISSRFTVRRSNLAPSKRSARNLKQRCGTSKVAREFELFGLRNCAEAFRKYRGTMARKNLMKAMPTLFPERSLSLAAGLLFWLRPVLRTRWN